MKAEIIKNGVKKFYGNIAKENIQAGCCSGGPGCCEAEETHVSMSETYENVEGYQKQMDIALGCGLPTEVANIQVGDTVIDLGSGAGNDVFIARSLTGESGKVIGVDMTPEMVIKAWQNNQKLGFSNVEFVLAEIEDMQVINDSIADVVISNCVMNLVPDKVKAFREVFRVLKKGGHFSISDIVYTSALPDGLLKSAELYSGCVAGASEKGQYLGIIKSVGFKNMQIKKERKIDLPDEFLLQYLSRSEVDQWRKSETGIYSITIYADKLEEGDCCKTTDNGCCGSELNATSGVTCCGTTEAATGCC